MSFQWFNSITIDGEKTVIRIFMGNKRIGDKCYIKIGSESDRWFSPKDESRDGIVEQGMSIIKEQLKDKIVIPAL